LLSGCMALPQLCRAPRLLVVRLHWPYCAYDVHLDAPSRRSTSRQSFALALAVRPFTPSRGSTSLSLNLLSGRTGSTSATPCAATTRLPAAAALPRLRRATGCISSPRRASGCLGTSRGSSSTTSPMSCVRVPRHVARLLVDYFAYAARPDASARHTARRAACRQLLRLHRASRCLGTSQDTSRGSSSTTSPTPCVWLLRHVARLVA
jgi:hypothetical protein